MTSPWVNFSGWGQSWSVPQPAQVIAPPPQDQLQALLDGGGVIQFHGRHPNAVKRARAEEALLTGMLWLQ